TAFRREGIALLRCTQLNLSVKCGRCRRPLEAKNMKAKSVSGVEKWITCAVCHHTMGIRFRPDSIHASSSTIGYLDLQNCSVTDLLPSTYAVTCEQCTTEQTPRPYDGLPRGQPTTVFCQHCHQPMTLCVDQVKFQRLAVGLGMSDGSGDAEVVGTRLKQQKLKDRIEDYTPGKPLPNNGSCKHFRRSHRWMRFPCCGKVYPCNTCHDDEEDHDHEWARRMICGYCSLEQPFSDKPCACGAVLAKIGHREFWEGGAGMRNRAQMSRREPRKYK
ncbi:hypothetical protein THASP1DRAFT_7508, partial [Thamnocephalis sphaerospora]